MTTIPAQPHTSARCMAETMTTWPHWNVIQKVAAKNFSVNRSEFYRLLPEYIRFMSLIASGYTDFGMCSKTIDHIWHAHVLHTRLYTAFCDTYIGKLVHHTPCMEDDEDEDDNGGIPDTPPIQCIPDTPPMERVPDTPPDDECLWSTNQKVNAEKTETTSWDQFVYAYEHAYGEKPPQIWLLK